jgi:hypothetical protein
VLSRARPYRLHIYLLTYTPLLLLADAHTTSVWQQHGLGLLTLGVLALSVRLAPPEQRRQAWLCVLVATGFEVLGSLVWGVYVYRFHNLPLYVPPGHGLVYLFSLTLAGTPLLLRHGRALALVVLALASAWALAGLTVLVPLTHRVDMSALLLPVLAWFLLRNARSAIFVGIFVATTELEIAGTIFGNWFWMPVVPWTHVTSGNPPAVISAGYSVIDGSVVLLAIWLDRLLSRTASVPPPATGQRRPRKASEFFLHPRSGGR